MEFREKKRRKLYDQIISWHLEFKEEEEDDDNDNGNNNNNFLRFSKVRNKSFKECIYCINRDLEKCEESLENIKDYMKTTKSELINNQTHYDLEVTRKNELRTQFLLEKVTNAGEKFFQERMKKQILGSRLDHCISMINCFHGWLDGGVFIGLLFYNIIQYLELRDIFYLMVSNKFIFKYFCENDEVIWKPLALRYASIFDDKMENQFEYLTAVYINEKKWKEVVKIINTKYIHLNDSKNGFIMKNEDLIKEDCKLFPGKYGLDKKNYCTQKGKFIKKKFETEFKKKVYSIDMFEDRWSALDIYLSYLIDRLNVTPERIRFVNKINKRKLAKKRKLARKTKTKTKRNGCTVI